ncbi:MAG: glutathione synthase [Pseudanabaena sp.]
MKLAFIIDPIARLDAAHDTSVALMEAACRKGYEVFITDMNTLSVRDSKAWAFLQATKIHPIPLVDGKWQVPHPWYEVAEGSFQPLENMQFVWMRPDPPVTTEYLYATYILDYVDTNKTKVLNSPQGIRAANEKMYALQFTDAIPKTIVTADNGTIIDFVKAEGKAVMKPLGGKGGEGILFLEVGDRNINSLIEISTNIGKTPVMVQEYLPDAQLGDKRIILLDGNPIGAVNRVPKSGEFRGNMAAGGSAVQVDITPREREICKQLAPTLKRDGLMFVGIDVIGGYLTEVNVTSPTGVREIDRLDGVSLGDRVMDWLAVF